MKIKDIFRAVSNKISAAAGSAAAFCGAVLIIVVWGVSGPAFHFSDTWQLVINTGTTIITFLMVFLIQNTQNRDSKAMQLKLDELIRSTTARNSFIDIEDLGDEDLLSLNEQFKKMRTPNPALEKLRSKIEAEHHKRTTNKKA